MKTVILATLENSVQASILQTVLRDQGIESFLRNDIISSVLNIPGMQIEVEVFEDDYDKALQIFKEGFPELMEGESSDKKDAPHE